MKQIQNKKSQHRGERLKIGGRIYSIHKFRPAVRFIFSQNTGSFEKYVHKIVRRTSSDFKTPQSLLKKYSAWPCILNLSRCLEIGASSRV